MKTSDPAAYQHVESITASSTVILNYRGLYCASGITISGTTWEKDSSGNWKTYSITTVVAGVLPFSPRTVSTISSGTLYGFR